MDVVVGILVFIVVVVLGPHLIVLAGLVLSHWMEKWDEKKKKAWPTDECQIDGA